jgi:non-heme chloroperoxidase
MRKMKMLWFGVVTIMFGSTLYAQDISGTWQGTLKPGEPSQDLRIVVQITKGDSGGWKATMYSIDQNTYATAASSVTLDGSNLKLTFDQFRATYEGKIAGDGNSVEGTWTQSRPLPLELRHATNETAWPLDTTPHNVQFVVVDDNVKLEVLDWGGTGRPLVLLTGLGDDAHVYDKFALKLTAAYHVYGITRRGFGASSTPATGYSADRLGDDVLAVLDSLKLNRPVLVGHSIGGEELSSVGSRHPEKVAGLIYLDAGYSYAYYDHTRGDLNLDLIEFQRKLEQLQPGKGPQDPKALTKELLETSLPGFEKDLQERQKDLQVVPAAMLAAQSSSPVSAAISGIIAGEQKYTNISVPVLAIYAVPHDLGPLLENDPATRALFEARDEETTGAQAKAFESGIPSAQVVRLRRASHYVFRSNEADVLREINAFLAGLP